MFAKHDALCPIVTLEVPRAALHIPIAFSKTESNFGLFAIQGFRSGHNELVDSLGNWSAKYVPAAYRSYPFALGTTEDQQQVLCFDTESDLLSDTQGNRFFEDDGELSPLVKELLDFLTHVVNSRHVTQILCDLLEEMELLEPWPITINTAGSDISIEGLFRVNEAKFNSLATDSVMLLRDKGAIPLIFSHLLSMQNISQLNNSQSGSSSRLPDEFSFDLSNEGGNISFDSL